MKFKRGLVILLSLLLLMPGWPASAEENVPPKEENHEEAQLVIEDFEDVSQWRGLTSEQEVVHEGSFSGRWNITDPVSGKWMKAVETSAIPADWSSYDSLNLWVHSEKATNDRIYVVLYSDNPATPQLDYYIASIQTTWQGWQKVTLPYYSFRKGYTPAGFNKIDQLRLHSSWYGETPDPETRLVLDQMTLEYMMESDILHIDGFEDSKKWTSVTENTEFVKEGLYSGKWENMPVKKAVQSTAIPKDWSRYDKLEFWMYSEKATGTTIYPILDSDDPETEGFDYYLTGLKIDWTGWKLVSIDLKNFSPSRKPLGLDAVNKLTFHSFWYSDQPPDPETVVYLDDLKLVRESFQVSPKSISKEGLPDQEQTYLVTILNKAAETDYFEVSIPEEYAGKVKLSETSGELKPGESKTISVRWKESNESPAGDEQTMTISIISRLKLGASFQVKLKRKAVKWEPAIHARPKSFISVQELSEGKKRIQSEPWAADYYQKLLAEADKHLLANLEVLDKAGGHGMWFLCDDSSQLQYDSSSPNKHYCPAEDRYYTGDSYDAGWRYYRHNELVKAARTLAVAHKLSGDARYGEKAAEILISYANHYPNYAKQARGGRLYWQTLDESVSMVDLAYTYDLLYDSGLMADQDLANIELNMLRPSAITISEYDMGRSNWQAWHNAAVGMIGFALGEKEYMEFAINGEHGFHYLMKESVLSDGFWWEGSIAYHLYALRALQHLADGAASWGYDLYSSPELKKMYTMPLDYAYPNLGLPFNNDGGGYGSSLVDSISKKGNFDYEGAFSAYGTSSFAWLLGQKYHQTPREGEFALFKGALPIPKNGAHKWMSRNFEGAGQGVLRSGDMYVVMDYGPYGGSHGHPDKLHIDLFANGKAFAPDFGTPSYGHVLYTGWYKQTVSHNTLVVDGASQKAEEGELKEFAAGKNLQFMNAEANQAYPGVSMKRSIFMTDRYTVDWMEASSPGAIKQYDWVFHGLGEFSSDLNLTERHSPLGSQNGYQFLENPRSAHTDQSFKAEWKLDGKTLKMTALNTGFKEVAAADGPGPSSKPDQKEPVLFQRQNGEAAHFVNVFSAAEENIEAEWFDQNGIQITDEKGMTCLIANPETEEGGLIAGNVTILPGVGKSCSDLPIKVMAAGENLTIVLPDKTIMKHATLMIKGEGYERITVNGKKTEGKKWGGVTVIEK
ncbi:heparinase II/III domain-containing protein [Metabacillus sp. 84]|uniref:heparinase II/III domain-containing protein n=1 Tax=Metabacillus sp. 84 TaxID=3404705 RepID=UPI003CE80D7A